MIPAACISKVLQGFHHGLHLADFPFQPVDLLLCQTLHIATLAGSVSPERQQFLDFLDRKAKVAGAPDEAQHLHFGVGIDAVARTGAPRRRDQPGEILHFGIRIDAVARTGAPCRRD